MLNPTREPDGTLGELRAHFADQGQEHVFRFWGDLDASQREALEAQARRLAPDLENLVVARKAALAGELGSVADEIRPVDVVRLPCDGGQAADHARARAKGLEMLRAGRVAVFVVAGGQGTRLGFDGPKGDYPIGPISKRSLFTIQAQKIQRVRSISGQDIPWYVMTSDATDAQTREIFARENNFGLPSEDVWIFPQQMVPAFDFDGRILLETPFCMAESPNGHGGALTALESSGALADMKARGIDTIFYYQVDNPLVKIADPVYLGFHEESNAEMSCKVVRKRDPHEKVGVVARLGEHVGIIEYTELQDEQRFAEDSGGDLIYWAGNIAIHILSTSFVGRVAGTAETSLPIHVSAKKIPTIDEAGMAVLPSDPNGHKLERFVFDALSSAASVCVMEADGAREFSPIKNADGSDSAATARRDLVALYREWLSASDIELPAGSDLIEIHHAIIDGPDDAKAAGFRSLADAGEAIQVASGKTS